MSALDVRNVYVNDQRTSLRLEPSFWDALEDIARRKNTALNTVISDIANQRGDGSLTSAVRVYVLDYYRQRAH